MNEEEAFPAPPTDEELPPPPAELVKESRQFGELKPKKSKPFDGLQRGFVIFGKDLRTIAKHGLVSAIILFIFLAFVFYIMSYTMEQAVTMDFGGKDNGNNTEGKGVPAGTGVNPPVARLSIAPGTNAPSGTALTLDASSSTDNDQIVFYVWSTNDGYQDVELYGKIAHYTIYATGSHEIRLTVVDNDWNMNESVITINTLQATADSQAPVANVGAVNEINVTETVTFDGSGSTDNVGIVDYAWIFKDGIMRVLHGETQSYAFNNAGFYNIKLVVRDAAGNTASTGFGLNVRPAPGDNQRPQIDANIPSSATVGDTVQLDASKSTDNQGISSFTWYVSYNGTIRTLNGQKTSFLADAFGPYQVTLVVRDNAGNTNTMEGMTIATPASMNLNKLSWTSTPFGTDISFNLLTYSYGIALLASVIYVGGLFAKGFTHEITKGTAKVLFFGPVSVTTMVFSKILYPLIIGPLFIFPLVFIGLSRFDHPFTEVFMIALVSYTFTAVTMVSAAYGSNLLYLATKRMTIKPSVVSRMFLYFSLLGTLTVFEWMSFLLDKWQNTDSWNNLYTQFGGLAALSPFHQGGMLLSNILVGTSWTLDIWVFAIPVTLIIGGVFASRKLYSDIFARE